MQKDIFTWFHKFSDNLLTFYPPLQNVQKYFMKYSSAEEVPI